MVQRLQETSTFSTSHLFSSETTSTNLALRVVDYFLPKVRISWGAEEYRQARITIMTALLAFATTFIITVFQIRATGRFEAINAFSLVGMCFFLGIPIRLKFTRQIKLTALLLVLVSVIQFWLIAFHSAGVFASILHPLFLVSTIGFLIGPIWLGWISVALCSGAVLLLCASHLLGRPFVYINTSQQAAVTSLTLCLSFVFCGIVIHYFRRDHLRVRNIALQALDDLAQARRIADDANQQKSSFLANMSHELRTPLNAIIGYAEILQEDFEDTGDDEHNEDIQKIHSSAKHLLSLLNDILDISKIEAGKLELATEPFDLTQLTKEVLATIEPLAQKNQNKLEARYDLKEAPMTSDPLRVKQVLFNLLSNACKFTQNGTVTLSLEEQNTHYLCRITDDGIGMTEEQLSRLFQPFEQASTSTAKKFGGTGLGLHLSQELCKMMGGSISCESKEGEGTTFLTTLPKNLS